MGIGRRIKEARTAKNMTQEELAEQLGVTKGAVANYENETSHPKELVMYKMFNALDVDANFLFQDVANLPNKKNDVSLAEYEHIKKYRSLDPFGQETVSYILDREVSRMEQFQKRNSHVIDFESSVSSIPKRLISYYYKNASAGTGQLIIDNLPEEDIEIPDIPEYRNVSYAIGVNGSSMEPTYHDGDILLVEATREIQIGEIGIFQVDDECFVKRLGENELISLNPDYENIPLNESARIMGRVINILK